jgi:hypothetical protein
LGYSYAQILDSEIRQNRGTVAPGPSPPRAGKGLFVRDHSQGDARRSLIRDNLTFGVDGVNRSIVRLTSNTMATSGRAGNALRGASCT